MNQPMMKPTLGKSVHYLENGAVFAAIIIYVNIQTNTVNLVFWSSMGVQYFRDEVKFSNEPLKEDKTWFWPPMVKPSQADIEKIGAQIRANVDKIKQIPMGQTPAPKIPMINVPSKK